MAEDNVLGRMKESLEGEVYGHSWLKPILALVEYEQTDDSKIVFIDLDRNIHVDHILPQEWQKIPDWRKLWPKAKAEQWLDRLGNLTLLLGRKNVKASNKPFDEKKSIYRGKGLDGTTAFLTTQRVINKRTWKEKQVTERQDWLMGQIGSVLGLVL